MRHDVSVIGLYILDILGRPVVAIPERGNVDFIEEIRLTVAGTAGGTVVDTAKLGPEQPGSRSRGKRREGGFRAGHSAEIRHRHVDDAAPRRRADLGHHPQCAPERRSARAPCPWRLRPFRRSARALRPRLRRPDRASRRNRPAAQARRRAEPHPPGGSQEARLHRDLRPHRGAARDDPRRGPRCSPISIISCPRSRRRGTCRAGRARPTAPPSIGGATCCVFTLGAEGAYYAHADGTRLHVPAYAIDVVDTTGCGDAFDAGFIAALHHRMAPEEALFFAQASAALVASGLGSDAGITSFDDTLAWMSEHRG